MSEAGKQYIECVEALRAARVRFAEQFAIAKSKGWTDGQATQYAIAVTEDELTTLYAQTTVARLALVGGDSDAEISHGV